MAAIAALLTALAGAPVAPATPAQTQPLPQDPLQRAAYKVVTLHQPATVAPWKLDLYSQVLASGQTADLRAKRTSYCPRCSGRTCADGSRVRRGICAAPRSVPMHSLVWVATDGLLLVCDRGGAVQSAPSRYLRRGEDLVVDVWLPRCAGGCWTGPGTLRRVPCAIVRRCE